MLAALCQEHDADGQQRLQRQPPGRHLAGQIAAQPAGWQPSVAAARRRLYFHRVKYLSTRDPRPVPATYSFEDVLLAGLAEDGGLFVPESLPTLGGEGLRALAGLPYSELAARVVGLFAGDDFGEPELRRLCAQAYGT